VENLILSGKWLFFCYLVAVVFGLATIGLYIAIHNNMVNSQFEVAKKEGIAVAFLST
jgi:hypothetical protein